MNDGMIEEKELEVKVEKKPEGLCVWKECGNNRDWFYCSCIDSKVNIWKHCKKNRITPVQLFKKCTYCGKRVKLEGKV